MSRVASHRLRGAVKLTTLAGIAALTMAGRRRRAPVAALPSNTAAAGDLRRQSAEPRLLAEVQAARATSAQLWHDISTRRAEVSLRIGQRGAKIGSFVSLDGMSVPIQVTSPDGLRRLFRRLPNELAACRAQALEAVLQGCERWDVEAAKVGLPEMVDHATKVRNHVRVLEARVAAQLGISDGAQA